MPDLLDGIAASNADRTAVIQGDRTWTFQQLNERANAFARGIRSLGVRQGDRAVWVSPNDEKVVLWGHTARKVGVISVPLNYRFTSAEMRYVIDDSDAVLVFCHPDLRSTIEDLGLPKVSHVLDHSDAERLIADNDTSPVEDAPEGLGGSMIYTSGTTGKPKGAVRRGVDLSNVINLITELGLSSDDMHLTTGPLYHSGPAAFSGLTHILGGTIVVLDRFDASRWVDLVQRHRVSTTFMAPTQMKRIVSLPDGVIEGRDTSSLRVVIANAAPVPYSLKQRWIARFGEGHLFEIYGSTELGVDTVLRPEDQLRKPGSCGRPYGDVEIRVLRSDGQPSAPGEPGDLWVRSPAAFVGYHKSPEKTEQTQLADDPDWRSVGDIAYLDDEGYVYICDRRSDMVISGGMNVYPAEIEAVLHSHPAVADVGVFGIPSEEWGEQVHAVVQLEPGADASAEELEALCRSQLAGYKVPRSWEFRTELPRTDSGKLLKRLLRDEHWSRRGTRV